MDPNNQQPPEEPQSTPVQPIEESAPDTSQQWTPEPIVNTQPETTETVQPFAQHEQPIEPPVINQQSADQTSYAPDTSPPSEPQPAMAPVDATPAPSQEQIPAAPTEQLETTQPIGAQLAEQQDGTTPPVVVAPEQDVQAVPAENPGQLFGILSIVFSLVGLAVVGIVMGVLSRKKSKAANAPTTLGTIGLIMSIIFTILGLLVATFVTLAIINAAKSPTFEETFNTQPSSTTQELRSFNQT